MPVLGQLNCGIVSGLAARKNTVQIYENVYLVQFCMIAQIYKLRNYYFAVFTLSFVSDLLTLYRPLLFDLF